MQTYGLHDAAAPLIRCRWLWKNPARNGSPRRLPYGNLWAMKRIIRRVQTLNERAAELTAVAGQLPKRVAELRETMTATTGQLHTLKSDIQVNIADLQMDREDDIGAALVEVAGHAPALMDAGFALDGLDVEVSPVQRIIVQLVRRRDVEITRIRDLIRQYDKQPTMRSILSAILKARTMVDSIEIDGLEYDKLQISIGPVPTIRLCWRDRDSAPASTAWQPAQSQPLGAGSQSSFFGPPLSMAPAGASAASPASPAIKEETVAGSAVENELPALTMTMTSSSPATEALVQPVAAPVSPPSLPKAPVDPLARFKVMPQLDRPR